MQGDMKDSGGFQQERSTSMEGSPRCATDREEDCKDLRENASQKQPCEFPLSRQDGALPHIPKGRIYHINDERVQALRAKVQVPDEGTFDRNKLKWEAVQNNGRGQLRNTFQAIIPWNRLWDFVEGESSNHDFPCKFLKVPLKCVQKPGQAENPRDSSALQKIRFHCEFGPEDKTLKMKDDVEHLKEKVSIDKKNVAEKVVEHVVEVTNDTSKAAQKITLSGETIEIEAPPIVPPSSPKPFIRRRASRVQAGKSKKRGCLCQFDAKQLYLDSTLCTIQFHCFEHVNEQGKPCHGRSFANVWEGNGQSKNSLVNHASRQARLLATSEKLLQDVLAVMSDIESIIREDSSLRASALADLMAMRGKLIDHPTLLSRGIPASQPFIPPNECNNQTRSQNSLLERSSHKKGGKKRVHIEQ